MRITFTLFAFASLWLFGIANSHAEDLAGDASLASATQDKHDYTEKHSKLITYKLAYRPATDLNRAEFTAKLTNVSGRKLELVAPSPKTFEALIDVIPPTGKPFVLMEREYLRILQMLHTVPDFVELAADQSLTWRIPVESLETTLDHLSTSGSISIDLDDLDRLGIQATPELLEGCKISSRINVGVLVPPTTSMPEWKSEFSIQTSGMIKIPVSTSR